MTHMVIFGNSLFPRAFLLFKSYLRSPFGDEVGDRKLPKVRARLRFWIPDPRSLRYLRDNRIRHVAADGPDRLQASCGIENGGAKAVVVTGPFCGNRHPK